MIYKRDSLNVEMLNALPTSASSSSQSIITVSFEESAVGAGVGVSSGAGLAIGSIFLVAMVVCIALYIKDSRTRVLENRRSTFNDSVIEKPQSSYYNESPYRSGYDSGAITSEEGSLYGKIYSRNASRYEN